MTNQEFNSLAERVLVAAVAANPDVTASFLATHAVKVTNEFVKALSARRLSEASKSKVLLPEEVLLLQDQPHPRVIDCIKSVRDRTGLSLKDAKDLVDKARVELGLL